MGDREAHSPAGASEGGRRPESFYVIRLIGLPFMPPPKVQPGEVVPDPNAGMLQAIRQSSRLERNGKPAIPCDHVFTGSGENARQALLFFPRGGANPITAGDKQVVLDSRFAPFHLTVKFPLKEMVYKGELSL